MLVRMGAFSFLPTNRLKILLISGKLDHYLLTIINMENAKMSPKDFFLQIGALVVLYVAFGTLIGLLFSVIDRAFLNPLDYYYGGSISWPVASLIILFPLYIVLMKMISKTYEKDEAKKNLGIRKWLTYLTLFITGAIMVGDLITILYYFLDGQLITLSFSLKVLVLLILSVLVFSFYLLDLQEKLNKKGHLIYGVIAFLVVLASIIVGFMVMGSPMTQRAIKIDSQRVSDLQNIQYQITNYWQIKQALPENLDSLKDSLLDWSLPTDPETKSDYEYTKTGLTTFKLCALFSLANNEKQNLMTSPYPYELESENWQHEAGQTCFDRTLDPDRYPPIKR